MSLQNTQQDVAVSLLCCEKSKCIQWFSIYCVSQCHNYWMPCS